MGVTLEITLGVQIEVGAWAISRYLSCCPPLRRYLGAMVWKACMRRTSKTSWKYRRIVGINSNKEWHSIIEYLFQFSAVVKKALTVLRGVVGAIRCTSDKRHVLCLMFLWLPSVFLKFEPVCKICSENTAWRMNSRNACWLWENAHLFNV